MAMQELARIVKPADLGRKNNIAIPQDVETLIIENQLGAVLFCAYGRQPTADDWDFAVPGSALFVLPIIGGQSSLNVLVDYPGAIPAGDIQAVIFGALCTWAPFVGALA